MLESELKASLEKEQEIINKLMSKHKQVLFPDNAEKIWMLSLVVNGQPFIIDVYKSLDEAFAAIKGEFKLNLKWLSHEVRPFYYYATVNKTMFVLDCWMVK